MEEDEVQKFKRELLIEEERSRRKAEWSRRVEMLETETEMKKASMKLNIEEDEESESKLKDDRSKVDDTDLAPLLSSRDRISEEPSSLQGDVSYHTVNYGAPLGGMHKVIFIALNSVVMSYLY